MNSPTSKNVMIDLETLSTKPNSQILTLGAIVFEPYTGKELDRFYARIQPESYSPYSEFDIDFGTIKWWLGQSSEARDEAFLKEPRLGIKEALTNFVNWIKDDKIIFPWSHGKEFDLIILQHHFNVLGIETPWKFWNTRDTRTLYDFMNIDIRSIPHPHSTIAHHAIDDCLKQISGVKKAFEISINHVQK